MPESPAVFSRELVDSERIELLWKGFTRRSKLGDLALADSWHYHDAARTARVEDAAHARLINPAFNSATFATARAMV